MADRLGTRPSRRRMRQNGPARGRSNSRGGSVVNNTNNNNNNSARGRSNPRANLVPTRAPTRTRSSSRGRANSRNGGNPQSNLRRSNSKGNLQGRIKLNRGNFNNRQNGNGNTNLKRANSRQNLTINNRLGVNGAAPLRRRLRRNDGLTSRPQTGRIMKRQRNPAAKVPNARNANGNANGKGRLGRGRPMQRWII